RCGGRGRGRARSLARHADEGELVDLLLRLAGDDRGRLDPLPSRFVLLAPLQRDLEGPRGAAHRGSTLRRGYLETPAHFRRPLELLRCAGRQVGLAQADLHAEGARPLTLAVGVAGGVAIRAGHLVRAADPLNVELDIAIRALVLAARNEVGGRELGASEQDSDGADQATGVRPTVSSSLAHSQPPRRAPLAGARRP